MAKQNSKNAGWTPAEISSLEGQIFIITGATSGTGFQATRTLLSKGGEVVMLNRNDEKSERVMASLRTEFGADVKASYITMDLSDLASVKAASQKVIKSVKKIDALICNAAIAQVPKQQLTKDGFESQLGTNHYGHFLLCGMLFDKIEASAGRIVVVSSLGYNMGLKTIKFDDMNWDKNYNANAAYSQSKLAQMMFAYELQDRIKAAKKTAQVYVCHPGSSATSLIETSGNAMTKFIFGMMMKTPLVQSAEMGAYPSVMCATKDGLDQRALYGPTGFIEFIGPVGKGTLKPHAYDKDVMVALWSASEKATGFSWGV